MVSGSKLVLLSQNVISSGIKEGDTKSLPSKSAGLILICKASALIDGSYVAKLQHSMDGITYKDVVTTASISADGFEMVEITSSILPYVRCELTSTGVTAGSDVEVSIYYGK